MNLFLQQIYRAVASGLVFLLFAPSLFAQPAPNVVLSGIVRDAENGETLPGAVISVMGTRISTETNEYGFYSLSIPQGNDSVSVEFAYVSFATTVLRVLPQKDSTANVELGSVQTLQTIVVEGDGNLNRVRSTQMGVVTVTAKEAKLLPAFFGEVDILKTLQLKPGVLTGGEGVSGVYVRGGGPDQNLFILDEAPVYNPNHLFGFFSTFNNDAVKNVELYKSGFPAQYGGKLSSVIDVQLNEGNRKHYAFTGGIGAISSRLTVEGPIIKDKMSFIVSGRRTYADLITRAVNKANEGNPDWQNIPSYYFYDLNTKLNYDLGENDRIYISGYFGRDVFNFDGDNFNFDFNWGNATLTARWNHVFNPKLFSNAVFTFSDYQYSVGSKFDDFEFSLGSGIRDFNFKNDYGWFPNDDHNVRFGWNAINHTFDVNSLQFGSDDGELSINAGSQYNAWELAAYANDEWEITPLLSLNSGLRLSGFVSDGKFYAGVEPRLAARYSIRENISLKASYTRMYQYIHLVSNSAATLPTDVWYPSTQRVKPQFSDQVSAGLHYAISSEWFVSAEGFHKWLYNQVDFRDGAQLIANDDLDGEFVFGKGRSYGAEFYLEKKKGKFTGWIGYTLSWAWRTFPDIDNGARFRPRYDRRHDISVVLMWQASKRLSFSGVWVFGTGNAFSLPDGRFAFFDQNGIPNVNLNTGTFYGLNIAPVYTARNKYRLPPYHRLDLNMIYKLSKPEHRFQSDITVSIFNAYDRRNPFFIYYDLVDENEDGVPERAEPKVVSLFPILPTVTFNFTF